MQAPTPKRTGVESRRVPRAPFSAKMRMKISPRMKNQIILASEIMHGEVIDISSLGLGVYGPVYLPKGTKINGKFDASALKTSVDREIGFSGIVKNGRMATGRTGYRLGIEFERIAKRNRKLLEVYVKKNLP